MANTITNTTILDGSVHRVVYLTIASDGTEETDYIVYDSSSFTGTDSLDSTIEQVWWSSSSATTAGVPANFKLEFDATTDVLALALPANDAVHLDFRPMGGLKNTAGSGITGDITLTTLGLVSGDSLTLVLQVRNH